MENSLPTMFVIINSGVCCHYQIEGGVFTAQEKAERFADDLAATGAYPRKDLDIVPVKVDAAVSDFELDVLQHPRTAIWP